MAHKGRIYEVRQDARIYSGQGIWPLFPAKRYRLTVDSWTGAPTGMPTVNILLEPHSNTRSSLAVEWRSEVLVVDSQEIEILLWVFGPTMFTKASCQYQILFNGVPQYEEEVWHGFENNTWRFLGANFIEPPPTVIGAMSMDPGNIARAVEWE